MTVTATPTTDTQARAAQPRSARTDDVQTRPAPASDVLTRQAQQTNPAPTSRAQTPRHRRRRPRPEITWVDATPFRALLRQLVSDTRLPASVLAVAIGIPPRTALALVSTAQAPRRIRWVDAHAMLERDYWQLTIDAHTFGDAAEAREALLTTCPQIDPAQLARLLCTEEWIAKDLLEGRITTCEQLVLWRALALVDGWTRADAFDAAARSTGAVDPDSARSMALA